MLPALSLPLGDSLLVALPDRQAVAVLNGTARRVLEALAAGCPDDLVADELAAHAGVPAEEARHAVRAMRDDWQALTRRRPVPSPRPFRDRERQGAPSLDATYRLGGGTVHVRIWPRRAAALIEAVAAPCRVADASPTATAHLELHHASGRYRLVRDGSIVAVTSELMTARSETLRQMILGCHPGRAWTAILHASAVAGRDGAVLLCGTSGAGKSTLTGRLLAAGLALVTDDYAPLEQGTGLVWPVPFSLSAKEGSWPLLAPYFPSLRTSPVLRSRARRQRYVTAPLQATAPHRAKALVFPLYTPDAGCDVVRLTAEEALGLCARSGGWFESSPERLAALVRWFEEIPAFAMSYGDTDRAVATVSHLAGGTP